MSKRFENKKLNKADHETIDNDAAMGRGVAEGTALLAGMVFLLKKVPWKKIGAAIGKVIAKV